MRITALIENAPSPGHDDLISEFGLSLHVETATLRILFDTGATGAFADNAAALGVALIDVDLAVLSHHHFDHGGGLARFIELNQRATVYLRRGELADRYFRMLGVVKRPIGLDPSLPGRFPGRFSFLSESSEVAPGVFLLTDIGSSHPRPRGNRRLYVERAGRLVCDPFDHELAMVVCEGDGMVIFSGCSHSGILNMIDAAVARFPGTPVKAIIGGFHLIGLPQLGTMAASRREVEEIGRAIMARSPGRVYSSHCTGDKAFGVLKGVMGDTLETIHTGARIEV